MRRRAVVLALLLGVASPAGAGDLDDMIRLGGITYVAQESAENARWPEPVATSLVGEEIGRVTCVVRGRQRCDTAAVAATRLSVGTPVHAVAGYRQAFRIAVRRDDNVMLYEAWHNGRATRGDDLYDLADKVVAIEVLREDRSSAATLRRSFTWPDGARIDDPESVARFVGFILSAPVVAFDDRSRRPPNVRYWLTFRFRDGTATGRAYDPDGGRLARALALPPEFRTLVEDAVNFGRR